jgi:serine/threonine protein kinase
LHIHVQAVLDADDDVLLEKSTSRVVVSDFGLARVARTAHSITATGVLIGTPEYWSPEQAMGRELTQASDLYSLGCITYLLLTNHHPFEGEDRLAVGLRRAHEDAPSLGAVDRKTAPEVVQLVDSLLSRDPTDRPQADQVVRAVRRTSPSTSDKPTKERIKFASGWEEEARMVSVVLDLGPFNGLAGCS